MLLNYFLKLFFFGNNPIKKIRHICINMFADISRYRRALSEDRVDEILFELQRHSNKIGDWIPWGFPQQVPDSMWGSVSLISRHYSIMNFDEVLHFLHDHDISDYYQNALFCLKKRLQSEKGFRLMTFFSLDFARFYNHIRLFHEVSRTYMDHDDILCYLIAFLHGMAFLEYTDSITNVLT